MVTLREEQVLEKFCLYSGEAEEESPRWALCRGLCEECREWIEGEALGGAQELPALEALAAAEAFYQLALLDDVLTPESLSAPELKLEMGKRAEKALLLVQEKRAACRGSLRETGFYFGSVKA